MVVKVCSVEFWAIFWELFCTGNVCIAGIFMGKKREVRG
jgi:hypothetical protein